MKAKHIEAVKSLAESPEREIFRLLIKTSWDKYVKRIFEIDPKLSEVKFSMKDLFVFYVKFCEHCANLPNTVMAEFKDDIQNNMDEWDIEDIVDNLVDSVMQDAENFVNQ